jgi:type I restriction enzyme S subunit
MLFYNLIANPYRKYLDLYAHGTANQASLNIEDMLNFSFAIPDGNEQRKIIEYLKISITKINDTASKIDKEIELLQEYRTVLISEAVTGKIKVA